MIYFSQIGFTSLLHSAHSAPLSNGLGFVSVQRQPSDPLYLASIELQNIVIGSRYRIERASDGLFIAEGIADASTITLTDQPAFTKNMVFLIKVRNASSPPYYSALETYGVLGRGGVAIWIDQKLD